MKPISLLFLVLTLIQHAVASEVKPILKEKKLGLSLEKVNFPETLRKDLTSGLTNKILVFIELVEGSQVVRNKIVTLSVRYDLWDEVFKLNIVDDQAANTKRFQKVDDVLQFISSLSLSGMFTITDLPKSTDLTFKVGLLLNPIEKQKMDKIRSWVAQNNTSRSNVSNIGAASPIAVARNNEVFNKIFEQYVAGTSIALWKETLETKPFKIGNLKNER